MVKRLAVWAVICLAAYANLAHGASAGRTLVLAHAAMNARVAPLWVARERGFFAKYGISAETIFVRGAPTLVAAMAANEIDVGYTGGTAVVGAVANGADLKVLAAFTNRVTYDLMVKPGIKSPEDLRGKKFGIQSIGGTVWMGAILALEHLKLDAERDKINILAVGDQNVLAQALESGTIDATVLDGVQSRRLAALGFPTLVDLNKYNLPILSSGFVMREPNIQKNPQLAENLMKAVIEGAAFSLSQQQKPTTLKILQKYLKVSEKDAEEGYRDLVLGTDKKPYANPAGVTNVVRLMKRSNPKVEKVTPEQLIDDRILKKIDQSGFIDEMMAKYGVK
ncbi:MAG TPA: ABC transporter substrate-binding protein [Terriglobales bacterium]|jgi:NitT/TauT family transport system substrate-binding protein|nr:ABC transporter substrate-binding protein [Terriglobales bacterium]